MSHAIAEAVRAETTTRGVPRRLAECRVDFAARGAAVPATYAAQFFSLVRRGILVAVDGRSSRTRYAHRETPLAATRAGACADADDDALTVLDALRRAVDVAGGPVTTAAVAAALRSARATLTSTDINAVRVRLQTLGRTRRFGSAAWRAPRVVSAVVTTVGGRRLRCWALTTPPVSMPMSMPARISASISASMPVRMPMTVCSGADAVRALVRHVQQLLGRPVFRRELTWWLAAHPDHPAARALHGQQAARERSLAYRLGFTAAADARRSGGAADYVLRRCGDRFSCWGGAAPRYWVGRLPATAALADHLDEVASGLRAADELAQLEDLARRAARAPALEPLIAVRRAALGRTSARALGADRALLARARAVLDASYAQCEAWAVRTAKTEDGRWARVEDLRHRARHVAALVDVPVLSVDADTPAVSVVGPSSAVPMATLTPFLEALELDLEISRPISRRIGLRGVRRLPLARERARFGSHAVRADAGVDRVDALLRVYRLVSAPRTHVLLDAADALLGPVLRDVPLLEQLGRAVDEMPALRRAVTVALALLGQAPAPATGPEDVLDARARLLAETLSGVPHHGAPADPSLAVAVRRLEHGRLLTALG